MFSFLCSVLWIVVCPFVLFLLAIVLYILFDLRVLIAPLLSLNSSYINDHWVVLYKVCFWWILIGKSRLVERIVSEVYMNGQSLKKILFLYRLEIKGDHHRKTKFILQDEKKTCKYIFLETSEQIQPILIEWSLTKFLWWSENQDCQHHWK